MEIITETIYKFLDIWIMVAFVGAVITSFNDAPGTFEEGFGHFFSWMFLPIIVPIILIIGLFRKDFKLIKEFFIYTMKTKKEENDEENK